MFPEMCFQNKRVIIIAIFQFDYQLIELKLSDLKLRIQISRLQKKQMNQQKRRQQIVNDGAQRYQRDIYSQFFDKKLRDNNLDQSFNQRRSNATNNQCNSNENSFVSLYRVNQQSQQDASNLDESFLSLYRLKDQELVSKDSQNFGSVQKNTPKQPNLLNSSLTSIQRLSKQRQSALNKSSTNVLTVPANIDRNQIQYKGFQISAKQKQKQSEMDQIKSRIKQSSYSGIQSLSQQHQQQKSINLSNKDHKDGVLPSLYNQFSKQDSRQHFYEGVDKNIHQSFVCEKHNQFDNAESISQIAYIKTDSQHSQSEISSLSDIQSKQLKVAFLLSQELYQFFYNTNQLKKYQTVPPQVIESTKLMIKKLEQGQNQLKNLIASYHLRLQFNNLSNKVNYQEILKASKEIKQQQVNKNQNAHQINKSIQVQIKQNITNLPKQIKAKTISIEERTKRYQIKPNFTKNQRENNSTYKNCVALILQRNKSEANAAFNQSFPNKVLVNKHSQNNYQILYEYFPQQNIIKVSLEMLTQQKIKQNCQQAVIPMVVYNYTTLRSDKNSGPRYKRFFINYAMQIQADDLKLQSGESLQNETTKFLNLQAKYISKRFLINVGVYKQLKGFSKDQQTSSKQDSAKQEILLELQQRLKIPLPMIYFFQKRFQNLKKHLQINIDFLLQKLRNQFNYYEISIQGQLQKIWVQLLHRIFSTLFDANLQTHKQQEKGHHSSKIFKKQYWLSLRGHDEVILVQIGQFNKLIDNKNQVIIRVGGKYGSQIMEDMIQFLCFMIAA